MTLALVRDWARTGASRRATSCSPSSPTRRPAASSARTTSSTTTPTCSRTAPRRSARSAASASPSATTCASTSCRPPRRASPGCGSPPTGAPGHGSLVHDDNAVTRLAEAVARIGRHDCPIVAHRHRCAQIARRARRRLRHRHRPRRRRSRRCRCSAASARMIGAALRNTANPTMLEAGYKANVIPGTRRGHDRRAASCPGRRRSSRADDRRADRRGRRSASGIVHDMAVETTFDGPLVDAMVAALKAEDPDAHPVPVPDERRHRREVVLDARHALLRLLPAAAARRTSTSRRCSTASTSGCRSSRCSSASGCSTGCCRTADGRCARAALPDDGEPVG